MGYFPLLHYIDLAQFDLNLLIHDQIFPDFKQRYAKKASQILPETIRRPFEQSLLILEGH